MTSEPTRDKLLAAAGRIFLEHGYEAASMDVVRRQAGVSNGSLYHHFPSKAHLAGALYLHTLRDFHAALLQPLARDPAAEPGVRGLVRAYLRWIVAHPDRARLLHRLRRSGELDGMEGAWIDPNRKAYATLRSWMEKQVAAGGMRHLPFSVWMALVFSPAYALTPQWVGAAQPSVAPAVRRALEEAAWRAVAPQ